MGRERPPGRGRGTSSRGGATFTALEIEEVFQDPPEDEDNDSGFEKVDFVVLSPANSTRFAAAAIEASRIGDIHPDSMAIGADLVLPSDGSNQIGGEKVAIEVAKELSVAVGAAQGIRTPDPSTSQKWGDRVEMEKGSDPQIPKGVPIAAQDVSPDQPAPDKGKKTWANVVGNRENGIRLDFVAPSEDGVVEFTAEDIEAGVSAWSTAVVGQIVGENPSFKEIVGFVHRAWSKIEIPRIHQLQSGVFLFNFKSEDSKRKIMARNWKFKQGPILLNHWTPDYKPATVLPTSMAVWIKLPDLNFQFWTKQGIEKIASGVGRPISTDALTANKDALKYARVLVEIDLLKPYPSVVKCKLPDGSPYTQEIIYEGVPDPPKWDFGQQKETANTATEKQKTVEESEKLPAATVQERDATVGQENATSIATEVQEKGIPNATSQVNEEGVPVLSETDSEANHAPEDEALEQNMPGTNQKKKRKRKKKLPPASVQERDATVGQENATSTATELQEKGIPNAASPVNEEGVPDPNKTKRNRKPNVRIWT